MVSVKYNPCLLHFSDSLQEPRDFLPVLHLVRIHVAPCAVLKSSQVALTVQPCFDRAEDSFTTFLSLLK